MNSYCHLGVQYIFSAVPVLVICLSVCWYGNQFLTDALSKEHAGKQFICFSFPEMALFALTVLGFFFYTLIIHWTH